MSVDPGAGGGAPPTGLEHLSEDEQTLHRLGYAQELLRGWGGFSNFAISFTIISILAGCLTSYFIAFNNGGPVAITWGWLIVGLMSTLVALAMAEIASAYPTAGGLYYWSSKLGSPAWGWFTGWFNLVGQIAVTAAIGYGLAIFLTSLLDLWFSYPNTKHPERDVDLFGLPPSALGVSSDVLLGEFPGDALRQSPPGASPPPRDLEQYLEFALERGYAGAWPWSFSGTDGYGRMPHEPLRQFARRHPELVNPRGRA